MQNASESWSCAIERYVAETGQLPEKRERFETLAEVLDAIAGKTADGDDDMEQQICFAVLGEQEGRKLLEFRQL